MDLDWDAGHGPVSGPVNATCAALAASWAGDVAHLGPQWVAAAAGCGLVGHHLTALRHRVGRLGLALRATTWVSAGAWCSWALATTPWSTQSLGSLAGLGLGLGLAWRGEQKLEIKVAQQRADAKTATLIAMFSTARVQLATEWEARVARVCNIAGLQIVGIADWPAGGGYTLDAELPVGGSTWKRLKQREEGLAADARLPEGCGVEVMPGAHRGAVILNVSTANHLINDVDYPTDYSPLSVNQPAAIGVRRDGGVAGHVMRQQSALIVGQRGSGKTNLLNVMLANQCRMVDSLAWVIDLNGGGLALKWLKLWDAAGRPGRPPVDWIADTPEKALQVAEALLRIAKARKVGYQDREIAADDDKLPVDADVPEIRLYNDEGAELFSTRARNTSETLKKVSNLLVQVLEIARAAAVNETTTGLRGTQDVLSDAQVLKQSTLKIGMRVADPAELNYFLGWDQTAKPEDAPYPGCAIMREGDAILVEKIYRIKPSQIRDVILATAKLRPALDDLSVRAGGKDYQERWDGTEHLFGGDQTPAAPVAVEPQARPASDRPDPTASWGKSPATDGVADALAEARRIRDQLHQAMAENQGRDPELEQQFREALAGGGLPWAQPAETKEPAEAARPGSDPRIPLVLDIVRKAGSRGINPTAVITVFGAEHPDRDAPSRSAVTAWLAADPRVHQPARGLYALRPEEK